MASTARITVDIMTDRLLALGTSPAGPLYVRMVTLGARVQTKAAQNLSGSMVKVRTGNLRSSLSSATEVRGTLLVETVTADASYALDVHEGTRPHLILPRTGRVLAWKPASGGPMVFSTRARHPGTTGRPFLADALDVIAEE